MEVVDAQTLGYDEFCARFLATNTPVKLRNVAAPWFQAADAQWRCAHDGSINFDALKTKYGHAHVPVVDGDVVEYGVETRTTMRLGTVVALQYAAERGRLTLLKNEAGKRYLKDWHFVHAFPNQPVYTWWDRQEQSGDDYRFVYIGPAGSWTPMHHDVFRSYSWSVNITGRKEWIFFHPDNEWKLKDRFGRYVIPDVTVDDIDRTQFPHAHEATPIHVTQEAGEAIFVPSGWYHQVKNVEATISINHNWFNGYNLGQLWQFFQREYAAVEKELEDLKELGLAGKEFDDQCQVVMKANTGINYTEFRAMLYSKAYELLKTRRKQHGAEVSQGAMAFDQDLRAHLSTLSRVLGDLTAYFADEDVPQEERVKALEEEVEQLKEANDGLYRQHANEKAQMQVAIEQEKLRFAELVQANDAYRDENEQWRVAYEQLETSKRDLEEQLGAEKKELEEKVAQLEESVKSYTSELVSDLEELEKEKVSRQSNEEVAAELQKQINEINERFTQLTSEYDTLHTAFQQAQSEKEDLEQRRADLETQSQQQSQKLQGLQAEIVTLKTQLNLQAKSSDTKVIKQTQDTQLRQAEQQVAKKEDVIAQLNQQVRRLEEEVSLLSLTCGGSAKPGPAAAGTLRDLQHQIFQKSEELVAQSEKNMALAEKHEQLRIQWQDLRNEVRDVRLVLLKGIAGSDVDGNLYQHVRLDELVRLRLKVFEHEWLLSGVSGTPSNLSSVNCADTEAEDTSGRGCDEKERSVHLANVGSFSALDGLGSIGRLERELRLCRSRNKRLQDQCEYLERELQTAMNDLSEFEGLKVEMVDIVGRERVEKELRQKCEVNDEELSEKIVALSEHIEKLMVHLKHEAAAKTKAMDAQRRLDKELADCRDKSATLQKKNTAKDQQIQELEQGAKILEDQLRLMDEKFIDVRNKLDWTRATSQKEVKKLNSELSALRMEWQLASDAGVLNSLPDWASDTKMPKKSKPLGASSSDGRLPSPHAASNNHGLHAINGSSSPVGTKGADLNAIIDDALGRRARFEIPKLPQPDADVGTPWSDAKLSVLQRQFQDKRKC